MCVSCEVTSCDMCCDSCEIARFDLCCDICEVASCNLSCDVCETVICNLWCDSCEMALASYETLLEPNTTCLPGDEGTRAELAKIVLGSSSATNTAIERVWNWR